MGKRIWFELWGRGRGTHETLLLARVKGLGLARLIAVRLADVYDDLEIRGGIK